MRVGDEHDAPARGFQAREESARLGQPVDFVAHRADYRRAIATLDLPVLVVHGRQDPAVPPHHATEVTAGFPRAGLRWVDACGHFPHLEHAAVVNGWLAEFLVGRPAPR